MTSPTIEPPAANSSLLTKRALASFLGVTPRTVEIYQRHGLPFYRLGPRRNRYDLGAVRSWLERRCRVERIV
ncbi:MAG: DNA-binding protein [Limisphaerales bacterium]